MLISRNDILKGVVPYYLSDDILNDGLHVRFENEPAEDFTGVTKDMFSSVWKTIREKFMTGENYSRINLVPGNLCSVNEYKAFGRILEHGFKLVGFVPIFFNPAQLFMILTRKSPSDELILESFFECLSENDAGTLRNALGMVSFDEECKFQLMNLLSSYEIKGLPQAANFLPFLRDIAKIELLTKPYFALVHMARDLWPADEEIFEERLKSLRPDGKKLVPLLTDTGFDDDPHAERVFGFLKRFVGGLNEERAKVFLRFVTGIEVFNEHSKISVQFNGVTDIEKMAPTVHPCGNTLTLSKYFFTYIHLEEIFLKVIDNPDFWNSFSML